MLQLRPNCECCDIDLPPDSLDARICTYECTFCARCADERLRGVCPNCGGEFVRRPRRTAFKLLQHPASATRVHRPGYEHTRAADCVTSTDSCAKLSL